MQEVFTGRVVATSGRSGVVRSTRGQEYPLAVRPDEDPIKDGDVVQFTVEQLSVGGKDDVGHDVTIPLARPWASPRM